jgi:hypothetical protein
MMWKMLCNMWWNIWWNASQPASQPASLTASQPASQPASPPASQPASQPAGCFLVVIWLLSACLDVGMSRDLLERLSAMLQRQATRHLSLVVMDAPARQVYDPEEQRRLKKYVVGFAFSESDSVSDAN